MRLHVHSDLICPLWFMSLLIPVSLSQGYKLHALQGNRNNKENNSIIVKLHHQHHHRAQLIIAESSLLRLA